MPSTNFENSAMKSSFSLSSLPISEAPENNATKPREFNSLKKKRREPNKRLSWGSTASEQKDDFWSILEPNYNYIMDNQLIDNCQDANCELSSFTCIWSPKEFFAHFSELYSWLNRIQEKIYGHEDNMTDRTLRAHCSRKILKKRSFYTIFNEQGNLLMAGYPEIKEEISWRMNLLNSKWETMEALLNSLDCEKDDILDIQREKKCLKNWIREMESRLQPLTFHKRWTKSEIETKAIEHKVLHKEIESHGKIVNSVVKLCKRSAENCRTTTNFITALERRWHLLFLRSMEWQCYIENYIKRNNLLSDSDSDEGPVKKQPRLSTGSPILNIPTATKDETDSSTLKPAETNENDNMNAKDTTTTTATISSSVSAEESQFNKSNRSARNFGIYYFKHIDTDSDMEKVEQSENLLNKDPDQPTTSETSEEEWTYSAANNPPDSPKTVQSTSKILEIRKIVKEVEELVSPNKRSNPTGAPPINKMLRIKQWLQIDKPDDSCDASSEDEENDSESSEELNESIATYRPQTSLNTSCNDLDLTSISKVPLRQKHNARGIKGQRPSSIASVMQLSKEYRTDGDTQPYSISESALHKLPLSNSGDYCVIQGNISTSSTVEESSAIHNEEHNSPLKKKRYKLKKKPALHLRKIDLAYSHVAVNRDRSGALVKSGSFSGRDNIPQQFDRQTVSDPSTIRHGFETSTTSGGDSDEEKLGKRLPLFKIGAKTSYIREDSPGKFSSAANEEQSSSICDEAWDSYQEKYSSEAYSEAHDSDAARRLLEFGEDYRSYLGSQSDWSTQSSQLESPQFSRKIILPLKMNVLDSDNEARDLRQLLKESRNQLEYTESVYQQQHSLAMSNYIVNDDMKELVLTCDRHLKCLTPVEKSPEEYKLSLADSKEFISDLISSWQHLKSRIYKLQRYRELQLDIAQQKRFLIDFQIPIEFDALTVTTIEELRRDLEQYKNEAATVEEQKGKLLAVNVAVNHFITENVEYNASPLRSDVSDLYRIWNEITNSAAERANRSSILLQTWQIVESRLDQLRGDLRDDGQTLGVLDSALQGGTFSNQMASSVRGVAKLLSETKAEGCSFPEILFEGSFSDSGISDEGSEHDLGERERRLSAIRRLMRQLEIIMAPDCLARVRMRERLTAAEEELRHLQNKCRSIIVRTAVTAAAPLSEPAVAATPGGDPSYDPNAKSWFKRVVRASMSFQFAIMALLFVACLLEPHCCDNMNNLHLSMNPQLHYVRGPPPM